MAGLGATLEGTAKKMEMGREKKQKTKYNFKALCISQMLTGSRPGPELGLGFAAEAETAQLTGRTLASSFSREHAAGVQVANRI